MNLYTYDGPVMCFDTCIEHRWAASTYAASVEKARNNLTYRYKKQITEQQMQKYLFQEES